MSATSPASLRTLPCYRPASGLNGARPWRVIYELSPLCAYELVNRSGDIVRFATHAAALRRADALNRAGVAPSKHPSYGWHMPKPGRAK